jgi:hypothetical protein
VSHETVPKLSGSSFEYPQRRIARAADRNIARWVKEINALDIRLMALDIPKELVGDGKRLIVC